MTRTCLIFILIPLLLSSCTSWMSIFVKIIDLENEEKSLEIDFNFKDKSLKKDVNVLNIMIFNNDTLLYELEASSDSTKLTLWHFPQVPEGFKITFPKNVIILREFNRTENITFEFSGQNNKKGVLGEWHFKPSYLNKENRWMFDNDGNKKVNIESSYESWLGKDIIKIYSNVNLNIDNASLKIIKNNNEEVGYEIKSKKDNPNMTILTLKNDLKDREILNLTFRTKDGNNFSDNLIVKRKSNIGIIGKQR